MKDFIKEWLMFTGGAILAILFVLLFIALPVYLVIYISEWYWILFGLGISIIGTLIFREI